jgi:glycosyltransferase involved in cell wall biosynthesis
MKILFVVTEDWYFVSHRLALAQAAKAAGHEVVVATRAGIDSAKITSAGIRLVPLELTRRGGNPLAELAGLVRLYRRERPDIIHHVALKPVVYGTLAARLAHRPRLVNAVAGLGWLFTSRSSKARLLQPIARRVLGMLLKSRRGLVIVQNPDDAALLRSAGVPGSRLRLILGAGVDTSTFSPSAEPGAPITVMLASRMLRDKGVVEFVEAARLLGKTRGERFPPVRHVLVGPIDSGNPAAIPEAELRAWEREGVIEWWGGRKDMPDVLQAAHVVCLPSYREGLPKVLLEAGACGRPLVATDAPGCREAVKDGHNGFLVPVRDAKALAAAIARLVDDPGLRERMGGHARELVLAEFSNATIIEQTLAVYRELAP